MIKARAKLSCIWFKRRSSAGVLVVVVVVVVKGREWP
jgi:hypothetical protein